MEEEEWWSRGGCRKEEREAPSFAVGGELMPPGSDQCREGAGVVVSGGQECYGRSGGMARCYLLLEWVLASPWYHRNPVRATPLRGATIPRHSDESQFFLADTSVDERLQKVGGGEEQWARASLGVWWSGTPPAHPGLYLCSSPGRSDHSDGHFQPGTDAKAKGYLRCQ